MIPLGCLLAWIKPNSPDEFVAAFVGEGALPGAYQNFAGRKPATQLCSSYKEARQWVQDQAEALDLPVKWVNEGPLI